MTSHADKLMRFYRPHESAKRRRPGADLAPAEISQLLADQIETLVDALGLVPNRALSTPKQWRFGNKGDLAIAIQAGKRGSWYRFSAGRGGDALGLVQDMVGRHEAMAWARRFLRLDHSEAARPAHRRKTPEVAESVPLDWSARAERIWRHSTEIRGTAAERYLIGRGCAVPACEDLRFLPASDRHPHPTMVARITDALTAAPISLHFTLLAPDGRGKADVPRAKRLVAGHRKAGGVIRLVDDAEVSTGLGIAEGIETALAVTAGAWSPVWATVDAGNMANLPVLPGIEALTTFADHDEAGIKAAQACAARWRAAGRETDIIPAPIRGEDWNNEMAA